MSQIHKTAAATKYVRATITAANDSGPFNPTSYPVSFAFTALGATPLAGAWVVGAWVGVTSPYIARIKVGPIGDINLAATDWAVWVQVITPSETVQEQAGFLVVD